MINIKRLDHIVLRTAQPAVMIAFYRDILNCPVERERADIGLYQLRAGDSLIDIVDTAGSLGQHGGDAPNGNGINLDHFCLQAESDDLTLVQSYLLANNVDVGPITRRYGAQGYGDSIYLHDPDGNQVELRLDLPQ